MGSAAVSGRSSSIARQQQQQQQQQQAHLLQSAAVQRRQLQAEEPAAVWLPPCDFGPILNFIGSFDGDTLCDGMQWLVQQLGEDAAADLHRGQVSERLARSLAPSPAAG